MFFKIKTAQNKYIEPDYIYSSCNEVDLIKSSNGSKDSLICTGGEFSILKDPDSLTEETTYDRSIDVGIFRFYLNPWKQRF